MRKQISTLLMIFFTCCAFAQQSSIRGIVLDEKGQPVQYATAALMKPSDSTLVNFGITNDKGNFEIKNVTASKYILQLSFVGYIPFDTLISIPFVSGNDAGIFLLQPKSELLNTVEIKAERTPLQIKGDTIEYNAAAFKTQPDASAEDLLKKLPGIEVDQAGNIKAQGEDVQQVLVDGKEFFSSDPTVATKNLSADAIDKVQVFDKTSEEADFTGVDDGARSKTINLLLKEDKKSLWMGDAQAGAGTGDTYQLNAKAYRFTKSDQFAVLGMLNDINQFGFSVNDYIDFNGGMGNLMRGGGFRIQTGDDAAMPVNFGQQVNGLITSGAAGLNYSHEAVPGNRFNVSYLGNGYEKDLLQNTFTQNFTPDYAFTTNEDASETTNNYAHRINVNFRNKPDSMQNIFSTAAASLVYGKRNGNYITQTYASDSLTNALNSATYDKSNSMQANADISYIHKANSKWKFIKSSASFSAKSTISSSQWNNITRYFDSGINITDNAYQNDDTYLLDYAGTLLASRKLKNNFYFDPSVSVGGTAENINRKQGNLFDDTTPIDSLSPDFSRNNMWFRPSLALKKSTKKTQWKIGLAAENLTLHNTLNTVEAASQNYNYILPQFSLEKEIRDGRRIRVQYESIVNAPSATQLLPVTNFVNPLSTYTGNSALKPEYAHNLYFNWMLFDQFSFTSLFTHLDLGYTKDKINYSKTINADLSQALTLTNVPSDYSATAGAEFSTPFRPLKLNVNIDLSENFDRGINYVNATANTINAFTHRAGLSFDNRQKDKADIRIGGTVKYTQASYSVEASQSSNYFSNSVFARIEYYPIATWRFSFNADIDKYSVTGFEGSTIVPLLQAQVSRYILRSNRGTISLNGYDLLNKNTGITQSSAYNYVLQQQSNTIGRYFLLSFKYRINKTAQENAVDIKVN